MPIRSPRSSSHGRFLLLLVLVAFLGTTGCSQLPRERWWQFWRKKPTTTASIYNPDQVTVPPPPADVIGQTPSGTAIPGGQLPTPPGGVTDPDPLRRPPAGTVTDLRTIHFDYNSDQVTGDNQALLEANAQYLKANPGLQIQIQGHTDERGTTEYNLSLGDRRAKAVKQYLMERGVEGDRLHTTTFGKERPIDPANNETAWAKNRRVQFFVY